MYPLTNLDRVADCRCLLLTCHAELGERGVRRSAAEVEEGRQDGKCETEYSLLGSIEGESNDDNTARSRSKWVFYSVL